MRIAFYAPLKPPDHPTPSGDRRTARLFVEALRQAGHEPFLASHLRSYDGGGDPARQARLAALGRGEAERFLRRCRAAPEQAPNLWFTYHLYYKAPDWLGPPVAAALRIPYIVAEASYAAKRAASPWAAAQQAVAQAIRQAAAVIGLNSADRDGILPLLADAGRWIAMKPFVEMPSGPPSPRPPAGVPRLIAVAMMRAGDKLASYRLLGEALSSLLDLPWSLEVIGDGPARGAVQAALAPLFDRVHWAGALDGEAVAERLANADLFIWPAVNEAFGMALLEAQASGLPVVAGRYGGVADIVTPETTGLLVPPGDAAAFAAAVRRLILDPGQRAAFGAAAWRKARAEHDLTSAARRLATVIEQLPRARAA